MQPPSIPAKTRLVVVDSYASVRDHLRETIGRDAEYEIVDEGRTGPEALRLCRQHAPNVLIIEASLPEINGAEVVAQLRMERPGMLTLIYTGSQHDHTIVAALRARPHGVVHKEFPIATLREALRTITAGGRYFCPRAGRLADYIDATPTEKRLTTRDRMLWKMIAEGMTNKMMADRLGAAEKTVEHYRSDLMQKLGLRDVANLTLAAVRFGVVEMTAEKHGQSEAKRSR